MYVNTYKANIVTSLERKAHIEMAFLLFKEKAFHTMGKSTALMWMLHSIHHCVLL